MGSPRFLCHIDDRSLVEAQIVAPAANMLAGWPALPPAGQGGGVEAQRLEQLFEKIIRNGLARLRALLLLYLKVPLQG